MSLIQDFVELGREIIAFDRTTAFGDDYKRVSVSPGTSHAQPGFMGHHFAGVVVLGQNPGEGNFGPWLKDNWELDRLLEAWERRADISAYDAAFAFFLRTFANSPGWRDWVGPILQAGKISIEEVAVLNLVKVPTKKNRNPTSRIYRSDWQWTEKQLDLLQPKIVVAGGVEVSRQLDRRYPNPPFVVHVQNRAKAIPGLSFDQLLGRRKQEADSIGTAIRAALARL